MTTSCSRCQDAKPLTASTAGIRLATENNPPPHPKGSQASRHVQAIRCLCMHFSSTLLSIMALSLWPIVKSHSIVQHDGVFSVTASAIARPSSCSSRWEKDAKKATRHQKTLMGSRPQLAFVQREVRSRRLPHKKRFAPASTVTSCPSFADPATKPYKCGASAAARQP